MDDSSNPFDSLESSYRYVCLLQEVLEEAQRTIDGELAEATTQQAHRRVEVLQVVKYKLCQLHDHLRGSRRILNDLRMLRRVILGEPNPQLASPVAHAEQL